MAEFSAIADQIINPGESAVFTETVEPCKRGFVKHREGSGNFLLSGWVPTKPCGCASKSADYFVVFGANIAVPAGETVGEISVAISLDGTVLPATKMIVTPAAVEEFFNVSRAANIGIWRGCCETVTITNTSTVPIRMQNANIVLNRPDLAVTR